MTWRAFRYRFHPTAQQESLLVGTFGCVRYVYDRALEATAEAWRTERRSVSYEQTSAMLTAWKRTEETAWLKEVSSVPLQQTLRHLRAGFQAFFDRRARRPRFKSKRRARDSAEFTRSGSRWRDGELWLAKCDEPLAIRWSRALPDGTVTIAVEILNVSGMVRNHALARAISDAGWSQFLDMLRYKCDWYGRDYVEVGRWFPSSKTCSSCGHRVARLDLGVREWQCPNCGEQLDRDVNAARNVLAAGLAVAACGDSARPEGTRP